MLPLHFVAVEVFTIAFTLGALTQNWAETAGLTLPLLFGVFYTSDFFSLPVKTDIYYHIWLTGVVIAAALGGHVYAYAMQAKPLVRFNFRMKVDKEGKPTTSIALGDLAAALFYVSAVSFVLGVNLWTKRTVIGVSPIGSLHETAGIALTLCGAFFLLATSIAMAILEVRVRLTLKYLWLFCIWPLGYLIADYGYYRYMWGSALPELLGAVVYFGISIVVTLGAIYLPIRKHKEDKYGNDQTTSSDIFYRNKNYAVIFFGGIALIVIATIIAFTTIISVPDESLASGAILMLAMAGISLVLSFSIFIFLPSRILSVRTAAPTFVSARLINIKSLPAENFGFQISDSDSTD